MRLVNQNWWFTTLLVTQHKRCPPLRADIKCDVAIVGGGFAGVCAAAQFLRKGLKVLLIDKNIIGGSSSGRSAGFLTPDSRRTQGIECIETGEVLTVTYDKILELYFQDPDFGYYFLKLTSERLLQNIARLEATVERQRQQLIAAGIRPGQ